MQVADSRTTPCARSDQLTPLTLWYTTNPCRHTLTFAARHFWQALLLLKDAVPRRSVEGTILNHDPIMYL
jgi:hypothetical protein